MIVSIHQPEHLPWLGFFDKMSKADVFVILDTVQFTKEDFQNRNRIRTKDGWSWVTVPVYKKGRSDQRIVDVEIVNDSNWRKKAWGLIRNSYRRSEFFTDHEPFFEDLYAREWTHLARLNLEIIRYLKQALDIETRLEVASELGVDVEGGTEVTLALSSMLDADVYLSGSHGRDYLDEARFHEEGIDVTYQEFVHPEYQQAWPGWEPRMASIDLLFNRGPAAAEVFPTGSETVVGA